MNVLIINGSPRVGGNTSIALKEMEQVFAQEGIETETIQVGGKDIRGCIACGTCFTRGKCVFDDLVNQTAPKFEACDGLVIASPVYYASANGTLISFLDRLFYSCRFDKSMKVGASVVVARRGGLSATFDELNKYLHPSLAGMPVASSQYWNSVHGPRPPARPPRTPRAYRPCAPWRGICPSSSRASPWARKNTACPRRSPPSSQTSSAKAQRFCGILSPPPPGTGFLLPLDKGGRLCYCVEE